MTDNEREMLREREETSFGDRRPFESSRQATYEDTSSLDRDPEFEDE